MTTSLYEMCWSLGPHSLQLLIDVLVFNDHVVVRNVLVSMTTFATITFRRVSLQ